MKSIQAISRTTFASLLFGFIALLHVSTLAANSGVLQFKGELVNGKKNGYGMLYYPDGSLFYRGNFKMNKMHGQGELFYSDGRVYEGTFSNGSPSGAGKIYFPDERFYQGETKDGLPHGYGSLRYKNGQTYIGNWNNGLMDGYGYMEYKDAEYEGYWKNGRKTGKGQFTTSEGLSCRGIFIDGQLNGYGTCNYPDGASYQGEWKNGVENGQGVMLSNSGEKRDGSWVSGAFKSGWITKNTGEVKYYDSEQDEQDLRASGKLAVFNRRSFISDDGLTGRPVDGSTRGGMPDYDSSAKFVMSDDNSEMPEPTSNKNEDDFNVVSHKVVYRRNKSFFDSSNSHEDKDYDRMISYDDDRFNRDRNGVKIIDKRSPDYDQDFRRAPAARDNNRSN